MKSKLLMLGSMSFLLVFSVVILSCVSAVKGANPTAVSINPVNQTVLAGGVLSIAVTCSPQQPVKGFELKVSFDPSLLQATNVLEGDFFDRFNETFFNAGIINNVAGTIVNIYDLPVGLGNVTNPGVLVFINFTAKSVNGTSTLGLYGVRVTNESDYINTTVFNGTVTIMGGSTPAHNTPPDEPPENPSSSENTPPSPPILPAGLTLIKAGIVYRYSSAAIDPDGDLVRLRFSWGDGSLSNWTAFVASNTSISAAHTWVNVSNYPIRVIAQDAHGLNSSWSDTLNVLVSQNKSGGSLPVGVFNVPENVSSNQTIVFDTSGIYDSDRMIVSYQWDFGDGTTGEGENPVHTYRFPGKYTVSLTMIDDAGVPFTITKVVSIAAGSGIPTDNDNNFFQSNINVFILTAVVVPLFILLIVYRDNIEHLYIQKRIEISRRRLAQFEGNPADITQSAEAAGPFFGCNRIFTHERKTGGFF